MNTRISSKTSKAVFLILLGLVFFFHFPFLEADPDRNMSVGRGPFTDEGLNTIQVRNWINQGELNLTECDNLLKTPLLGFPLAATYKIFGTTLVVSRLHVLMLVLITILIIGLEARNRPVMTIFILITLMQYQVFQSSHFSMAEMLSVAAVLLSIDFLARSFSPDNTRKARFRQAVLSGITLSLAYMIKIQFIYLIPLLPLTLLILVFSHDSQSRMTVVRQGFTITAVLLLCLLLYFFAWYLPNKKAYDFMMAHQSGEISLSGKTWEYIRFNLSYHFLKGWVQWFIYFFITLIIIGFIMLRHKVTRQYPVQFFSSLVWVLLELHKLTMVYLPTRYQVSLFASIGLLMSVVLREIMLWQAPGINKILKVLAITILISMTAINGYQYVDTVRHRTYVIRDTNEYMAGILKQDDLVLGAWAPSLTWGSKSRAIPVWNHFLNYQDPVNTFLPRAIIAETDEQDSEQAFSSQGINLQEFSDSTKTVRIGQWKMVIYWMKPKF
ncbi:MAG: hypothetical protein MUC31_02645 [Bacteroidales bacterium]|jgi:hypothetical protein|nr:hypothetical protein [Bacteroidales bacterium]